MEDSWNDYLIENTDVLKNKFNMKDNDNLHKKEKEIVLEKLVLLNINPIEGDFDSEHLKKIHKFLFSDIYYFAGEYRNCSLAKTTRNFYDASLIDDLLKKTLNELKNKSKNINEKRYYSYILAEAYYELMSIHPFREGNGRSVREFLREFVLSKNKDMDIKYELDFSKMDKDLFLKAVEYRYIYHSLLEEEFYKSLISINKCKK